VSGYLDKRDAALVRIGREQDARGRAFRGKQMDDISITRQLVDDGLLRWADSAQNTVVLSESGLARYRHLTRTWWQRVADRLQPRQIVIGESRPY
jgi:hypothetical protein